MCCKTLCNRVVSEHRPAAERLVHGLDVRRKCVSDIAPKYAGLTVEYVVPTHGVCVLKVIVKHELSFIIDAERGIKVIREREPVRAVERSRKEVLCAGIHHQEHFGEQIVKQHRSLDKMVFKLRFELCQPVFGTICGVFHAVICHRRRQCVPCCRRPVCGNYPLAHSLQLSTVCIIAWVSRFKIVLPCCAGKICGLVDRSVGSVVQCFPRFAPVGKAKHIRSAFVEIKVVLAPEPRFVRCRVLPENHTRRSVNRNAHTAVRLLRRGLVRNNVVVKSRQLHVVCALAGGHVRFHTKHRRRDGILAQQIAVRLNVVCRIGHAALELQLKVLLFVACGGSALHVDFYAFGCKAAAAVRRIDVGDGASLFIALALRQLLTLNNHVRQRRRKLRDYNVL